MARLLRGEIRWAELSPVRGSEQGGRRPVLILSHDVFNERSGTVIAMALTSQAQRAGFPLTLARIRERGFETLPVDLSEFAKADGGATCLSLVIRLMNTRKTAFSRPDIN